MQKTSEKDSAFSFGDHGVKTLFSGTGCELGMQVLKIDGESGVCLNKKGEQTILHVIEGTGTIRVNDAFVSVAAGDTVRVEEGEMHNIICTGVELKLVYLKCVYSVSA
ncbi:MAG: cupin domain-containing protein [PVC group bacterium]|nr:cupin domain-containing protein [PVC group bacterium]